MSKNLGELIVTDYIDRSIDHIERVESALSSEGLSFNSRCNILCDLMKRGINFGIQKGGYIYKSTQDKIQSSKDRRYKKWLENIVYSINEEIEQDMIKNKYKKK